MNSSNFRALDRFGQETFAYGGFILGSKKFTLLLKLPLKIILDLKVVIIDLKIIILLHKSKSVTHCCK